MKITKPKAIVEQQPTDILADAIIGISAAMERLLASGVNQRAVTILIHHDTKINIRDINRVFDSLSSLREAYMIQPTCAPR